MPKYKIFFGAYAKNILYGEFDGSTGEIIITGESPEIHNPSYLQLSSRYGHILYGVSENDDGEIFSLDLRENKIISNRKTNGKHPCHLCVTHYNLAVAANYSEGSLSIFETDDYGGIKPSCQSIKHYGKSVNPNRQTQSHAHFAKTSPDYKYLAVCDLGLDKVFFYPYSPENGLCLNARIIDCPPGSGPRHLIFSKDSEYLYILTELKNTVLAYKYNGGEPEFMQEIPTLPSDFSGQSTAAAIFISPDGKLLGASNRGCDSIALFNIKDNGGLEFARYINDCKEPRDFRFSPDNKYILSANQNGGCVTVYDTKDFSQVSSLKITKPVCILFGEEI